MCIEGKVHKKPSVNHLKAFQQLETHQKLSKYIDKNVFKDIYLNAILKD